ncbi:MAG: DNA-protecting protein DprA [Magnetococcales bacterium]|nr:DNA-protecting protein DprA [Magnetococcales bacterium]
MTPHLSFNTQAILLLTSPLLARGIPPCSERLTPGEYKRLARHLRELQRQPADLIAPDAAELLHACHPIIDENRLHRLLARGLLLAQVVDHWRTRSIWVISRADASYPRQLKAHLKEDSPAVLYGCGDIGLLGKGGLAVVGSRQVDDELVKYTASVARLAARFGKTLISGGARGIDQAAMFGALEAGGNVCGVLADSLERAALQREYRHPLLEGRLVLISPYDPVAGFHVGSAMQRNKLIYSLAEAALVVQSDLDKGGTWAGAVEQLERYRCVPVYARATAKPSPGLDGLRQKGALVWPDPQDEAAFQALFSSSHEPVPPPETADPPNDFNNISQRIQQLLQKPMRDGEVAKALEVSLAQAKVWLQRLMEEGVLEMRARKPATYAIRQKGLFD